MPTTLPFPQKRDLPANRTCTHAATVGLAQSVIKERQKGDALWRVAEGILSPFAPPEEQALGSADRGLAWVKWVLRVSLSFGVNPTSLGLSPPAKASVCGSRP